MANPTIHMNSRMKEFVSMEYLVEKMDAAFPATDLY